MAVALALVSLYFLYLGFRKASRFCLSLAGIAAGLCLASSISGKQYLLALVIAAPLYGAFYRKSLNKPATWTSMAIVGYGFLAAATPILYTSRSIEMSIHYYEGFFRDFWHAARTPSPTGIRHYTERVLELLFQSSGLVFFFPIHCQFRCLTTGF